MVNYGSISGHPGHEFEFTAEWNLKKIKEKERNKKKVDMGSQVDKSWYQENSVK